MNWLLIVVAAIIAGCTYYGYKQGIVKIIFSICTLIASIVLSMALLPYVNTCLRENTEIYIQIRERCQRFLDGTQEEQEEDSVSTVLDGQAFPQSLKETVARLSVDAGQQMQDVQTSVADGIADMIHSAICFMITLLVIRVVLWILLRMLNVLTKLPVMHSINQMAGLAFGFAEGLVIVWIFFIFLTCILQTSFGQDCMQIIAENKVLAYLFDHNILTFIFRL